MLRTDPGTLPAPPTTLPPATAALPSTAPASTAPPGETTVESVLPTTTTVAEAVVIQGVGDVNFDPGYIPAFRADGYEIAFTGLDGAFLDDDVTVINLECSPALAGVAVDKEFVFQCDPSALPIARSYGVEVANLANNHGQDYGRAAMLEGRWNLWQSGIWPVGVGRNLEEAHRPAVVEAGGRRVAVLGFGGVHPSSSWLATDDRAGMADGDDIEGMAAAVAAAKAEADIVVVTIHWGIELITDPTEHDRRAAEAMIAAGADAIFGHHPHRLGEVEFIDGKPVFWTLGNFVWPRLSDAGATTAIARVIVSPDGAVVACQVPVFIESGGHPVLRGELRCPGE